MATRFCLLTFSLLLVGASTASSSLRASSLLENLPALSQSNATSNQTLTQPNEINRAIDHGMRGDTELARCRRSRRVPKQRREQISRVRLFACSAGVEVSRRTGNRANGRGITG